ncbi:hypothetical protein J3R03_003038 [Actinoplanes couchii]|nr:hypothetical protein [Actinoplanes couchii]
MTSVSARCGMPSVICDLPRIDPEMRRQHRIESPVVTLLSVLPMACHDLVEKNLKGGDEFARTLIHARQANREPGYDGCIRLHQGGLTWPHSCGS